MDVEPCCDQHVSKVCPPPVLRSGRRSRRFKYCHPTDDYHRLGAIFRGGRWLPAGLMILCWVKLGRSSDHLVLNRVGGAGR
jgi:hypothetical protein